MPHYREHFASACDRLLELFYTGQLRVAVDPAEFWGVEAIPAAVTYLLQGQNCGKVVVRF
jgi:NADPH-dependent curcumin reductase CurA